MKTTLFTYFQPAPPKTDKYTNENKWPQENFTIFHLKQVISLKKFLSVVIVLLLIQNLLKPTGSFPTDFTDSGWGLLWANDVLLIWCLLKEKPELSETFPQTRYPPLNLFLHFFHECMYDIKSGKGGTIMSLHFSFPELAW